MRSINNCMKYRGCDFADDLLKPNVRIWLDKNNFKNTLNVPIRRKGMTGSGIKGECHGNVFNLVKAIGGKQMSGFAIRETLIADRLITDFFRHSVWLTPEGSAVDVTAHNFSKNDSTHFLPISEEKSFSQLPYNFGISDDIADIGVWISKQHYLMDLQIAKNNGFKIISNSKYQSFVLVPNKYFTKSKYVRQYSNFLTKEELVKELKMSGFTNPSSATGKSWEEIFETKVLPKCL